MEHDLHLPPCSPFCPSLELIPEIEPGVQMLRDHHLLLLTVTAPSISERRQRLSNQCGVPEPATFLIPATSRGTGQSTQSLHELVYVD